MEIKLYRTESDSRKLDKTFTSEATHNGNFAREVDIINPIVQIEAEKENLSTFNYCYIPDLERYYFIDKIEITRKGFFTLFLHIDVLKTYAVQIRNLYGVVGSGASVNPYYRGYITNADVRCTHEQLAFQNNFNETGDIILLGMRGVQNT